MAFTHNPIDSYQIIARLGTPAQGSRTNRYDIVLKNAQNTIIGVINFWKPTQLQNSYMGSNGYPEVHLEEHHYAPIVDLLRNEGPLTFSYDPTPASGAPLIARITTLNEEVGAGD